MQEKVCNKCGVVKSVSDFYIRDGYIRHSCKKCENLRSIKWYQDNLEHAQLKRREYCRKNKEEQNKRRRRRVKSYKQQVYDAYGRVCSCCGEHRAPFLSIDHVNNDGGVGTKGKRDPPETKYKKIINEGFPDKYRILCHNCNFGRYLNGGTCPHKDWIIE